MWRNECSHCQHLNLPRAIFCFECGESLVEAATFPGIKPLHLRLIKNGDTIQPLPKPRSLEAVVNARQMRETADHYNGMLGCLRCAAVNKPNAEHCVACGANLIVTDEAYGLQVTASARTSVGRVRNNNEDTVGLWARQGVILGLVADGMGGAAAGEEASRLAKEAVQADFIGALRGSENIHALSETEIAQKLRLALMRANTALLKRIQEDRMLQGMGTTSTLALVRGNHVYIAHIGDSRAYLINGKYKWIHQITDDHSFVEALVASGHITRAQAAVHPMRSVLYRALGQSDALGSADFYAREVQPGDRIVLCSDGLTRHVEDEEIAQITLRYDDPEDMSQALIDLTLERGAEDNVSVVVLAISASEARTPTEELTVLLSEQEPPTADKGLFATGRLQPEDLKEARAAARDQDEEKSNGSQ